MAVEALSREKVYSEYIGKVRAYIGCKISNRCDAEDLASDVFVKVYNNWEEFSSSKSSISTWIYTITKNTVIDYYRRNRIVGEIPETLASDDDVVGEVIGQETLRLLVESLGKLDERSRDIIILHYYRHETIKEIAERLGISYVYAKIIHKNALAFLKTNMEQ